MEIVNIEKLKSLEEKFAIAIGFFDGVHLGHQSVINNAINYAKENHAKSMVITFDRSPKVVLGNALIDSYLTPIDEKLRILKEMGVNFAVVLKFDSCLSNLNADEFIDEYLLKIGVCYVSVGFDFRFGQGGAGNTTHLLCHDNFKVDVSEPVLMDGVKVSSSRIKNCLKMGDLDGANQMLGRHFSVNGEVVRGQQLGRTIGFPTANLKLDEDYYFPLRGVYGTISHVDGARFMSMTNIGFNPTANLQGSISNETHIFNFDTNIDDANLYGKELRVEFLNKIRDEIKFSNLNELIAQLEVDKSTVESMSIDV